MAGLLDFVAGFGVGALGGVAEQKKANLEQKRQLNLAKLKAEYASDIEKQREERAIKQRTELMELYRTNPDEALEQGFILGETLPTGPEPTASQRDIDAMLRAQGLASGTPEYNEAFAQAMGTKFDRGFRGKGNLVKVTPPGGESFVTTDDDPSLPGLFEQNPETRIDPIAPERDTDAFGREIIIRGGKRYVVLPDGSEIPQTEIESGAKGGGSGVISSEAQSIDEVSQQLYEADYLSLATGPLQAAQRFGLAIPGLGDILAMGTEPGSEIGAAQTRAAKTFEAAQRSFVKAYRFNPNRTSNLDIKETEKLFPKFGALSVDASTYNQSVSLREDMQRDINTARQIARVDLPASQMADEKTRMESRQYLNNIKDVLPKLDAFILGYEIQRTNIDVNGEKKNITKMSFDDVANLPENAFDNLPNKQRELLKVWFEYKGWL